MPALALRLVIANVCLWPIVYQELYCSFMYACTMKLRIVPSVLPGYISLLLKNNV